jgi:hypothetical protein
MVAGVKKKKLGVIGARREKNIVKGPDCNAYKIRRMIYEI